MKNNSNNAKGARRKKRNFQNRTKQEDKREYNDKFSKSNDGSTDSRDDKRKYGANDLSWYTRYPDLLTAAASFPYPYRPGMSIPGYISNPSVGTSIPGVYTLNWAPYPGYSATPTDPISVAAKEIYAKVRSSYSGSLDADAPDFIMYLLALDSIYSYIAMLKRTYRVLTAYTPSNYVLPDTVLIAMGYTPAQIESLRTNKDRLWQEINSLIYMSRKFTCPSVMDMFNRHYWLNDNLYTDAASLNAQFYLFNMVGLLAYTGVATPDGVIAAGLQYMRCDPEYITSLYPGEFTDVSMYKFGRSLIDSLVEWDDSYTINGYLMRAYDGTPQFIVENMGYDEVLTPIYNEEVLTQIENARTIFTGTGSTPDSILKEWHVSQDPKTNTVLVPNSYPDQLPQETALVVNGFISDPIISIRSDAPTVGDNTVATRLSCYGHYVPTTANPQSYELRITAGTELLFSAAIYLKDQDAISINSVFQVSQGATQQALIDIIRMLGYAAQFDWHPCINIAFVDTTGSVTEFGRALDLHNTTVISPEQLENLHTVCLYSELNAFNA